jgi:hypothetical protein
LTLSRSGFVVILFVRGLPVAQLLQFANEKAVQVVRVRIIAAREVHLWVKPVLPELLEAWLAEGKTSIDNLDVTIVQCILHNSLVLFYGQSAGGVHDVTSSRAVRIHNVYGR